MRLTLCNTMFCSQGTPVGVNTPTVPMSLLQQLLLLYPAQQRLLQPVLVITSP